MDVKFVLWQDVVALSQGCVNCVLLDVNLDDDQFDATMSLEVLEAAHDHVLFINNVYIVC